MNLKNGKNFVIKKIKNLDNANVFRLFILSVALISILNIPVFNQDNYKNTVNQSEEKPVTQALEDNEPLEEAETNANKNLYKRVSRLEILSGNLDTEGASPTYCLNFNYKPLINSFNLSQNIEITPNISSNFNPVDNKLCITGFNYATDYTIKVNKGFEGYESKLYQSNYTEISIPNRKPSIRFQRNKYVLTKADKMSVPLKVVNTDKVDIKVFKIPGELVNEIRDYDYEYSDYGLTSLINSKGTNVWQGKASVANYPKNEEFTMQLNIFGNNEQVEEGVYIVSA